MEQKLIELALKARLSSYSPYSHYCVGAALLTESGKIYSGCNIENSSYGATNCAERTTIFKAVSEGEKVIKMIAVVGGNKDEDADNLTGYAYPCGICRQVMREFSNPQDLKVIIARSVSDYKVFTLEKLLPNSFGPEYLN